MYTLFMRQMDNELPGSNTILVNCQLCGRVSASFRAYVKMVSISHRYNGKRFGGGVPHGQIINNRMNSSMERLK
jgi:hypothetical protein